jgi:NurA-like 5'-3' nuclease
MWSKETRSGVVFIVDAEAVLYDGRNIKRVDDKVLIDAFRPGNHAKERISLVMQLMELQLAIKNGDKADLILLDGSLAKKIGRHKVTEKISDIDNIFTVDDIISLKERESEEKMHKLLVAENHYAISLLIEKYREKLLFISKNSKSSDIFGQPYSDVVVLELFTQGIGYTQPMEKTIEDKYVVSKKASRIMSNLKFYTSLVRLDKDGRIEFINTLAAISVRGYPYPLLEVHKDVRISRDDVKRVMRLLGFKPKQEEWWPSQFL